jgi:hypothetical protein
MGDEGNKGDEENKLDDIELEKQLGIMCMYDEFDDCRHLVEEVFECGNKQRLRSFHMEVAIELAYTDYLDQKRLLKQGPGYDDQLRRIKVDVLTIAKEYVAGMATDRGRR